MDQPLLWAKLGACCVERYSGDLMVNKTDIKSLYPIKHSTHNYKLAIRGSVCVRWLSGESYVWQPEFDPPAPAWRKMRIDFHYLSSDLHCALWQAHPLTYTYKMNFICICFIKCFRIHRPHSLGLALQRCPGCSEGAV